MPDFDEFDYYASDSDEFDRYADVTETTDSEDIRYCDGLNVPEDYDMPIAEDSDCAELVDCDDYQFPD